MLALITGEISKPVPRAWFSTTLHLCLYFLQHEGGLLGSDQNLFTLALWPRVKAEKVSSDLDRSTGGMWMPFS